MTMEDQSETMIPDTSADPDVHEECHQRMADLEAKWKRARADYENREKELAREREDFAKFCSAGLIRDFLSIIDAVEAAGRPHPPAPPLPEGRGKTQNVFSPAHGEGERPVPRSFSGVGEGVGAVYQLCRDFLKRHGVESVGVVGEHVDYLLHEVVGTRSEQEKSQGVIVEVMQSGYTMHGRLLRPAKVIVASEPVSS